MVFSCVLPLMPCVRGSWGCCWVILWLLECLHVFCPVALTCWHAAAQMSSELVGEIKLNKKPVRLRLRCLAFFGRCLCMLVRWFVGGCLLWSVAFCSGWTLGTQSHSMYVDLPGSSAWVLVGGAPAAKKRVDKEKFFCVPIVLGLSCNNSQNFCVLDVLVEYFMWWFVHVLTIMWECFGKPCTFIRSPFVFQLCSGCLAVICLKFLCAECCSGVFDMVICPCSVCIRKAFRWAILFCLKTGFSTDS